MTPLILPYQTHAPRIAENAFVAPNVTVIGKVVLEAEANVWYGSIIRGDVGKIFIRARANVQDMCVVHTTKGVSETHILEEASIGHGVIIHGAIIEAGALVGMGCIIMDNARVGEEAIIGAGSLITGDKIIPPRTLAVGRPARVVRELSTEEVGAGRKTAARYMGLANEHRVHLQESPLI